MPRTTEMDVVQREREDSSEGSVQILSRGSSTLSFRRPSLATGWKIDWGPDQGRRKRSLGSTILLQWTLDWM